MTVHTQLKKESHNRATQNVRLGCRVGCNWYTV